MPGNEESFFRKALRERIAAEQNAAGNEPAKVICMIGSEARVVEVMAIPDDEDYVLVRTEATVQREGEVATEKVLLHIQIDHFILVESA